jgi:hypothetical protein
MRAGLAVTVSRIRLVSTTAVSGLALAAFTMSFGALHSLARAHHIAPGLAWLWPLVVDGFIVTASLGVLHAVLERRSAAYPWALVLLFSAVSVAGNLAHGSPDPVGRLVSAVPPVALVLAFDLLMRELRWALQARATSAIDLTRVDRTAAAEPTTRSSRPLSAPASGRRARELVAARRASGARVSGSWLASELGVSDSYARRLLRQLGGDGGAAS